MRFPCHVVTCLPTRSSGSPSTAGSSAKVDTGLNVLALAAMAWFRFKSAKAPASPAPNSECKPGQSALACNKACTVDSSHTATRAWLSLIRNDKASGPNSIDSGMATAPICSTAI